MPSRVEQEYQRLRRLKDRAVLAEQLAMKSCPDHEIYQASVLVMHERSVRRHRTTQLISALAVVGTVIGTLVSIWLHFLPHDGGHSPETRPSSIQSQPPNTNRP